MQGQGFPEAPGILGFRGAPLDQRNDDGFDILLEGDLAQKLTLRDFLRSRGFDVGQRGVYPALRSRDAKGAYELIWKERVEGWWNLEREFVSRGVCTAEEFSTALKDG